MLAIAETPAATRSIFSTSTATPEGPRGETVGEHRALVKLVGPAGRLAEGSYRNANRDGGLSRGHDPQLVDSLHLEGIRGPHANCCQVLKVQGLQHGQLPGDGVH